MICTLDSAKNEASSEEREKAPEGSGQRVPSPEHVILHSMKSRGLVVYK